MCKSITLNKANWADISHSAGMLKREHWTMPTKSTNSQLCHLVPVVFWLTKVWLTIVSYSGPVSKGKYSLHFKGIEDLFGMVLRLFRIHWPAGLPNVSKFKERFRNQWFPHLSVNVHHGHAGCLSIMDIHGQMQKSRTPQTVPEFAYSCNLVDWCRWSPSDLLLTFF